MTQPALSIIIITRNESKNISRCIESIAKEAVHYDAVEIILVDSASTDETVEIAGHYAINVLRLKSSWFLSAAAGRYIGTLYSRGDWLLFLDGDMALAGGWLEKAMGYIQEPMVGGISGNIRDVYTQNGHVTGTRDYFHNPEGGAVEAMDFGGAALYSRSAMEKTGGFNPFLKSDEEPELCLRLRAAGYKLIRLPDLMALHYCIPSTSLAGQIRRARLNYFIGFGQISRAYWGTRLFWVYQKERGFYWPGLIVIFLTLAMLASSFVFHSYAPIGIWILLLVLGMIAFVIRKQNIREALQALLFRALITYGAARGFLIRPQAAASYPTDVEIVKRASQLGGLD